MSETTHTQRTKKAPKQATSIGQRLRSARLKKKLFQSQIAEACDVTRAAVSQWEDDATRASIEHLELAAKRLGVDFEWLCLGTERTRDR